MAAEICTDSFLINMLGNLQCTFSIENRTTVQAVYGTNTFSKTFLYTPGTFVDTEHANYGFFVRYDPAPGDTDFPAGVTITGSFVDEEGNPATPDLSGNLTEARKATFRFTITMDRDTYPGGEFSVTVTLGFNPGA